MPSPSKASPSESSATAGRCRALSRRSCDERDPQLDPSGSSVHRRPSRQDSSAWNPFCNHPAVWRGSECARVAVPSVPTGFAELDARLPGGGWPAGALTEIHVERTGVGELQLVMPAAARLTQSGRWLTLIAPPYVPYAPALAAHGVRLSRLLLVRTAATEDSLWACEQALRSQACGAVLAWLDRVHERALRRLQLAAESGGASCCCSARRASRPPRRRRCGCTSASRKAGRWCAYSSAAAAGCRRRSRSICTAGWPDKSPPMNADGPFRRIGLPPAPQADALSR